MLTFILAMFIRGFWSYYKSHENFENNNFHFLRLSRIDTFGHLVDCLYSLGLEFTTHNVGHMCKK
jgi:hypothetical protein